MKPAFAILTGVALLGCAQPEPTAPSETRPIDSSPSSPLEPPTGSPDVWIWLMVVDQTGVCIPGATIQVVAGQDVGEPITQETPCDAWAYSGGVEYHKLSAGVSMTLRAAAPGYAAEDTTVTPGSGPLSAIIFAPLPLH